MRLGLIAARFLKSLESGFFDHQSMLVYWLMSSISLLIPNLAIDEERFFEVIGKDFSWMTSRED